MLLARSFIILNIRARFLFHSHFKICKCPFESIFRCISFFHVHHIKVGGMCKISIWGPHNNTTKSMIWRSLNTFLFQMLNKRTIYLLDFRAWIIFCSVFGLAIVLRCGFLVSDSFWKTPNCKNASIVSYLILINLWNAALHCAVCNQQVFFIYSIFLSFFTVFEKNSKNSCNSSQLGATLLGKNYSLASGENEIKLFLRTNFFT